MIDHITPTLNRYFKYDKLFDLLDYDEDLTKLHDELKLLCRDSYEPNYRFIFLHYDTDYYITNSQPGILLRNLQRITKALNIGNYFCLILSQQDLQKELDQLRSEETTEDISISCITHPLQEINYFPRLATDLNTDYIDKHYISLTRAKRFHRILLFALLRDQQLLDKGMVSFGSKSF